MEPFVKSGIRPSVVLHIDGPFNVKAPSDTSEISEELTFMEIRKLTPPCAWLVGPLNDVDV
jgi:hypothetical protein